MTVSERYTTENSLIMLVDHQTGTLGWVKSLPQETVVTGCRVLARMAVSYAMPLVLTTTMEAQVGPTIPAVVEVAGEAFAARYARGGARDCWDDPALREGVAALGRRKLIMAGLTTDICLFWAARTALKLGYDVLVVADACGTTSVLGDTLTYDRLRADGAQIAVVNQVVTELANDFGAPQGQAAQQIMGRSNAASAFSRLPFPTMPGYSGTPWFMPIIGGLYRLRDRLDGWREPGWP